MTETEDRGQQEASLDDPQLRPFLPLLYVAWADGSLTEPELAQARDRVASRPWLTPRARRALSSWLDPERPPKPEELDELLATIRETAGTLARKERRSLADLGVAMLDVNQDSGCSEEQARGALEELEAALGVVGHEAGRQMLAGSAPAAEAKQEAEASFEVGELRARLDGPHAGAREQARMFLAEPAHRPVYDLPHESYRQQVWSWLGELAQRGFGARAYPGVTTGDSDLGPFLAIFETLAFGDQSLLVKLGVQFGLFGGSIYFLGNDSQRREYLGRIARCKLPGCFAMSEAGHGSNVMALETTAQYDAESDELVIHTPRESARKEWIGNAALHGQMATVFAQLEVGGVQRGVHAVLVPLRDESGETLPGVRIQDDGPKLGLNGVDNGRLWFDRVRVPRSALLDRFGTIDERGRYDSPIPSANKRFFTMLGTLVAGRMCVASAGVSAAKVGLAIAVRYATHRRQFGPADGPETCLLDYETHQQRLLPALATTYALHFATEHLRGRYLGHTEEDAREVEALAAGLKAWGTSRTVRILQQCRESCGGQGYLAVNRLSALMRDSEVYTTFEGDNTVLLQLVAKARLTGFKQQFEESRFVAVMGHLARRAATAFSERNPLIARRTDEEHLRDPEFQRDLLRAREEDLLHSAAARFKKRLDSGMDSHGALLETQAHLVAMAEAHVERVLAQQFVQAVEQAGEGPVRDVLARLRDLFVLDRIQEHGAWFLENGYIEPVKARAVRKLAGKVQKELVPDARALVDAFGIPDACLAAPIAFGDPAYPDLFAS
jgi:acyl-CoA oxidase